MSCIKLNIFSLNTHAFKVKAFLICKKACCTFQTTKKPSIFIYRATCPYDMHDDAASSSVQGKVDIDKSSAACWGPDSANPNRAAPGNGAGATHKSNETVQLASQFTFVWFSDTRYKEIYCLPWLASTSLFGSQASHLMFFFRFSDTWYKKKSITSPG